MRTIYALERAARFIWRNGNFWGRFFLGIFVALLIGWPVILFAGALVAPPGVIAVLALAVPVAALLTLLIAYPVATGAVAGAAVGGQKVARGVFKGLFTLTGIELLIGTYFVFVPVKNDPGLLVMLTLAFAALVFLAPKTLKALGGLAVVALTIIVIAGTFSFFAGGRAGLADAVRADLSSQPQIVEVSPGLYEIELKGEGVWSEPFSIDRQVPACWGYRWKGPESATVRWSDGATGTIGDEWGVKGGKVQFSGPAGRTVIIRVFPPPDGATDC